MINHENKFAYLGAGKTGSSTISSALRKIKGTEGAQHRTLLSVWNKPNNNIIPNNYFTFTFCRNPYSRLPSAWREFKKSGGFKWAKTEKYWNRDSFKLHGLSTKNVCEDFHAFVRFATIQNHIHWCQFDFLKTFTKVDFIGKFENLQEDFDTVCDKLGIPQQRLPHKNKSNHKHYTEYYDDETRQIVAERYAKDIKYFGYKFGE